MCVGAVKSDIVVGCCLIRQLLDVLRCRLVPQRPEPLGCLSCDTMSRSLHSELEQDNIDAVNYFLSTINTTTKP